MFRLSDPDVGDFDLDEFARIHVTSLDFGFPDIRRLTDPWPVRNGTNDRTQFFGARTVAVEAFAEGDTNMAVLRDRLAPYFDPARRPYLITDRCDYRTPRRIRLAADKFSGVMKGRPDTMQFQWIAPDGILEDATESLIRLTPDSVSPGFWFPIIFPLTFPRGTDGGGTPYPYAHNNGTLPAEWTAVLVGAINKPFLELQQTGEYLSFPGLNLPDGDFVVIDSRTRTVKAAGTQNRISTMDFANSTWFRLPLGTSTLRIFADSWGTGAACTVSWHDAFLI